MNIFSRWAPFALALAVALFDRATKIIARRNLDGYTGVSVVPGWLRFLHTENPGAAFSFLSDGNPVLRRVVLIGVSSVVMVGVARALWKNTAGPTVRTALAFVLGGAAGNLWDRVIRGSVTDFIEVYHGAWSFPVFNVADSAITVGAALILLDLLFARRKP